MNLIIGHTSQLSYYFPPDYIRISSRNIDFEFLKENIWESVYICFAEQNMIDQNVDFITPNFLKTKQIIEALENSAKKVVIFTTCELWNQLKGPIDINTPFNYIFNNDYCYSKDLLWGWLRDERMKDRMKNVIVIHPFSFNSTHRTQNYLFGKIFHSIINKEKINIGYTYYLRDIVHTKYMVEKSIKATKDEVIGSGQLTHVNGFIRDLYASYQMNYKDWVIEDLEQKSPNRLYYSNQKEIYSYKMLMNDTIEDIQRELNK